MHGSSYGTGHDHPGDRPPRPGASAEGPGRWHARPPGQRDATGSAMDGRGLAAGVPRAGDEVTGAPPGPAPLGSPTTGAAGDDAYRGVRPAPACCSSGRRRRPGRVRLEAVICDIDEVVIRFDPDVPGRIEARHGLRAGSLLETVLEWPTARLASVGAISYQRWLQFSCQTLPPPAVDEWLEHHGTLNQDVVELLTSAVLAGVRLLFLCNSTDRLYADLAHHDLGDLAACTYSSAEIRYAKPDPRAYEHVLRAESLHPARTLYVDDVASWVETARELGMRGHHYVGSDDLRRVLTRAGVAT